MESDVFKFTKWQGLGNDFILCRIENLDEKDGAKLASRLCSNHWGIGADGLIFLLPGKNGSAVTMEIFNADGTIANMCGNGIRCLASWAFQQGWVKEREFSISTRAGLKCVTVSGDGPRSYMVEVDMGEPDFIEGCDSILSTGDILPSWIVSMGNLHRVVLARTPSVNGEEWLRSLDLDVERKLLEQTSYGTCNVEFVYCAEANRSIVRVHERGVGETLACGTGSCATVVATNMQGWGDRVSTVSLPGGELYINWKDNGHIFMTGPAVEVFSGQTWQ